MATFFERMKSTFGYGEAEAPPEPQATGLLGNMRAELQEASTLNTRQRFWAFGGAVICTAACWGLSALSIMTFNISGFVTMFTLGNISALVATCFLVGPRRQWRNMVTRERMGSAAAFVGSMVLTLFACAYFGKGFKVILVVLPCLLVQMVSLLWYSSTYIPGGQGLFLKILGRSADNGIDV